MLHPFLVRKQRGVISFEVAGTFTLTAGKLNVHCIGEKLLPNSSGKMSTPSSVDIVTVDAFTSTLFKGNPAAVVLTSEALDEVSMKCIAREMNLSETAFAHPIDSLQSMSGVRTGKHLLVIPSNTGTTLVSALVNAYNRSESMWTCNTRHSTRYLRA